MRNIYLTSSISFSGEHIGKKLNAQNNKYKTAFITTPVEGDVGDLQWLEDDRNALKDAGFDLFDYTITNKTEEQIKEDLKDIEVMYCSGGNTFYFLEKSKETGFDEIVREMVFDKNIIYISTSAGSVIAGPDIYPAYNIEDVGKTSNLTDYKSFGLVDFVILPHWGSKWFKEFYLNRRLEHAYTADYKLILLNDYQYVEVFPDKKYRIVDVRKD